ncbi:MAG: hypothetical protein ACLFP9_06640 [Desulfonatronovibrio sp.]
MQARGSIEQRLLQEIKGLDREETEKIFKMIHFMKEEILKEKDICSKPDIMQYAGMLSDLTPEEGELFERAVQRKSMFGGREVEL